MPCRKMAIFSLVHWPNVEDYSDPSHLLLDWLSEKQYWFLNPLDKTIPTTIFWHFWLIFRDDIAKICIWRDRSPTSGLVLKEIGPVLESSWPDDSNKYIFYICWHISRDEIAKIYVWRNYSPIQVNKIH